MHVFKAGERARALRPSSSLQCFVCVELRRRQRRRKRRTNREKQKHSDLYEKKCCSPILFVTVWYLLGVLFNIVASYFVRGSTVLFRGKKDSLKKCFVFEYHKKGNHENMRILMD